MKTGERCNAIQQSARPAHSRPHALATLLGLGAAGATLLVRRPAQAAAPLTASLTAKKVAGQKVRSTVKATVALPGLNWSGTLGTWDVPEGGKRQVSVQPPGMPVPFDLRLEHLMAGQMMQMMLMMQMMTSQQPLQASASAKVS
ncbi:MAG: hypothetical protein KF683_08065 [Rubrivivax sp.]|nr:hypothetical protein [Rubrivivax sp.]